MSPEAAAPARRPASPEEIEAELARLESLANLMDARFRVLGLRVGLDSIVGLVPGIGDVATTLPAAWILWRAWRLGASPGALGRMAVNLGIDTGVGAIPILGDIFDVGFRSNKRNVALLRRHLQPGRDETMGPARR
jgi:hypothetical protein